MKEIQITDGTTVIHAVLNGTVAAQDFEKRLPCTFSGSDSGMDYCCPAANGLYDPLETRRGWKNGDISLCDGWQSDEYGDMMIIGHIHDEDLPLVRQMPPRVTLKVETV